MSIRSKPVSFVHLGSLPRQSNFEAAHPENNIKIIQINIVFFIFTPIYKIYFIIEKRLTIFEESKNPKIIAPYS